MKKIIVIPLLIVILSACKGNNNKEIENIDTNNKIQSIKKHNTKLESGCYNYNKNGNVIELKITVNNNKVNGKLDISYDQKDKNQGELKGELKGDTLIGTYTFLSEGLKSTRDIAFLVKGAKLIEGSGELNETGTKFKNSSNLQFISNMPLTKIDCE